MKHVKITKDLSGIPARVKTMTELGQYALVNQVHADSNPYVPMLTSDLRNQSNVGLDGKSIVYNAPYAKKQYHTQFSNYTTAGTGPYWDKKAKAIHGQSWVNIVKKAMK